MSPIRDLVMRALCALPALFVFTTSVHAEDPRDLVSEAIKRGEKRIIIPPGSYRLDPRGGGEIWKMDHLRDIEIVADGVTIIGTKLMRTVGMFGCSNVMLSGLTVDYDPLPFTQGEIIAAADDGDSIDVKLHAGYPKKPYARIDVIDRETRFRKKNMPFLWGTKGEMIGEDTVRIRLKGIAKFAKPGDLASLSTGQETGAPHAISIDQCEKITFKNVTVHSAPGMGILEADGEGGSTFSGCKIVPGPKPDGATEERLLSSSWDAFQSKTIRKGPLIENCEIREAGDDSWSVQSSDFLVLKCEGSSVVLASRDEFTAGVQNGDRLRTSVNGPEWKITSRKVVSRGEAGLAPDVLEKLTAAKNWDLWHVSPKCIVITVDKAPDLKAGDSVYSPDRMGAGFVFRKNKIHSPGRILLKAGGLLEDNVIDVPHAVIACPEIPGTGATGIEDLTIRGNIIRNGGWFCAAPWSSQAGILSLTVTGEKNELRTDPVYKNVVIENNTIEGGMGPHLVVSSTEGLIVKNNRFVSPQTEKAPETGASYQIPNDPVVWITKSSGVIYERNEIKDPGPYVAKEAVMK